MREACRHDVLRAVLVEERLEPGLGHVEGEGVPRLPRLVENVLDEPVALLDAVAYLSGQGEGR